MTATALKSASLALIKSDPSLPAFFVIDRVNLFIRAGTSVATEVSGHDFENDFPVLMPTLVPGTDYYITIDSKDDLVATEASGLPGDSVIGGFHFAPGGNATARAGGDDVPAINPFSCWDRNFRPACPDPRGMALVDLADGSRLWVDIYKLGVEHLDQGTSRFGVTIADGRDCPKKNAGGGRYDRLDYPTALEVYAHHGKQLLSYDEFRAAAFGVTEKTSADNDPKVTGLDVARTSQRGIMQATGNLWDWGHDGDTDAPRASLFGGSWLYGGDAGSRCADLGYWPDYSYGSLGARGRSDHLTPAA